MQLEALEDISVIVRCDSYDGKILASFSFKKGEKEGSCTLASSLIGKHAIYFEFRSNEGSKLTEIARFNRFTFD